VKLLKEGYAKRKEPREKLEKGAIELVIIFPFPQITWDGDLVALAFLPFVFCYIHQTV
jgi:hypothetical protein